MDRIEIFSKAYVTLVVCAVNDASDAEIIKTANEESPIELAHGWQRVVREDISVFGPKACPTTPGRTHFVVTI